MKLINFILVGQDLNNLIKQLKYIKMKQKNQFLKYLP
jgi:hypothetical protein